MVQSVHNDEQILIDKLTQALNSLPGMNHSEFYAQQLIGMYPPNVLNMMINECGLVQLRFELIQLDNLLGENKPDDNDNEITESKQEDNDNNNNNNNRS